MNTIYKSLILSATIFLVLSCKSENKSTSENINESAESARIFVSKKQFDASKMKEGKIENKVFEKTIQVNGQIAIPNKSKAIVSSMIDGTIGSMNIIEGQWVKKSQTLLRVSNPELIDLQEQYLVLQSKTNYLREEQNRKQKLVNENLVGKQELLLAQSDYQSNQAMFNTVSQKLKLYGVNLANITSNNLTSTVAIAAPISGFVTSINAKRGQYINPSTEVMTLASKTSMYLSLNVLERDGAMIHKGQNITFSQTSNPTKKYQATVSLIQPTIDDNGMLIIHCHVKDSEGLLPGMYITANLILDDYESDAVAENAIVQIEGKSNVLIQSSNTEKGYEYLPKIIEVGQISNGFAELKKAKDLQGKTILIEGGYYLTN